MNSITVLFLGLLLPVLGMGQVKKGSVGLVKCMPIFVNRDTVAKEDTCHAILLAAVSGIKRRHQKKIINQCRKMNTICGYIDSASVIKRYSEVCEIGNYKLVRIEILPYYSNQLNLSIYLVFEVREIKQKLQP